jgi:hypothetical protein
MSILLISITESFGKSLARRTLVPALGPGTGQPRTHRVAREGLPLGVSRTKFGDGFSGRLDREPPAQSKAALVSHLGLLPGACLEYEREMLPPSAHCSASQAASSRAREQHHLRLWETHFRAAGPVSSGQPGSETGQRLSAGPGGIPQVEGAHRVSPEQRKSSLLLI